MKWSVPKTYIFFQIEKILYLETLNLSAKCFQSVQIIFQSQQRRTNAYFAVQLSKFFQELQFKIKNKQTLT